MILFTQKIRSKNKKNFVLNVIAQILILLKKLNALIKLNVNTCPVDEYGSPSPYCKPSGFIESSLGNPITFKYDISPQNMKKFFCVR